MALAFRLHKLDMLSEWRYKSTCIELSKRGYRSAEPIGIDREVSTVWKKIISNLWSEKESIEKIAKSLNLPIEEMQDLVFGLIPDESSDQQASKKSPVLRVVK